MSKHTPERLKVDSHPRREYPRVTDERGRFVADCASDEHARRIVACWNVLQGFTTEQLEAGLAGMVALTEQRDVLLAALQAARLHIAGEALPTKAQVIAQIDDAIAKATGEAK